MPKNNDYGEVKVVLDYRRPMSIDGPEVEKEMSIARHGNLEYARQILRGVYTGMCELRRHGDIAWDSPAANFGLLGLSDQLAAGLAVLEEIGR